MQTTSGAPHRTATTCRPEPYRLYSAGDLGPQPVLLQPHRSGNVQAFGDPLLTRVAASYTQRCSLSCMHTPHSVITCRLSRRSSTASRCCRCPRGRAPSPAGAVHVHCCALLCCAEAADAAVRVRSAYTVRISAHTIHTQRQCRVPSLTGHSRSLQPWVAALAFARCAARCGGARERWLE